MSGVDRISVLPDAILCHILSFLPSITVVAATTTLSKRWRYLWQSVPTVDLDDGHSSFNERPDRFLRFAHAVMFSGDVTQHILKFRLKFENSYIAPHDINMWLQKAMERKVETIDFSSNYYLNVKLPAAVLTCSSLVVLKLKNIIVDSISTVNLPLLKTLDIDFVRFSNGEYLEMILSGCPNIHHLRIKRVKLQLSSIPPAVTFPNLIHVELFGFSCKWLWIVRLLDSSPILQVLDIGGDIFTGRLVLPDQPPGCLSSHLRACTVSNFHADEVDIQFVTYILKNARVLNKMTIFCRHSMKAYRFEILRMISMIPSISTTCRVWLE